LIYEPIIRNAPIIVPVILAAGIIAVTVYRPQPVPTAPGVATMAAQRGASPIACADTLATSMLQEKEKGSADAGATDQTISQGCP
jgi:hypothetical protein